MALPKKTRLISTRLLAGLLFVLALAVAGAAVAQVPDSAGVPDSPEAAEAAAEEVSAPASEGEFAKVPDPELERLQALFDTPTAPTPAPLAPPAPSGNSIGKMIWQMLFVLLLMCGVIILGGALSKRFLAKTPALAGARLGSVLGRVYLSPKVSLHYVKTGGRVLVLGVSPGGIHLITEFAAEAFDAVLAEPKATKDEAGPNFLEYLSQAQRPERGGGDDDIANLRGEIQRLSEFLRDSSRDPHA